MTLFCANDPCEFPATKYYAQSDGRFYPLCETCGQAFALGQAASDATLRSIFEVASDASVSVIQCDNCLLYRPKDQIVFTADLNEYEMSATCHDCQLEQMGD